MYLVLTSLVLAIAKAKNGALEGDDALLCEACLCKSWHFKNLTVVISCAKGGDLIEVDRTWYKHWFLYAGDGLGIQTTSEDQNWSHSWISRVRNIFKYLSKSAEAVIDVSTVASILGDDKARVNNKDEEAKMRKAVSNTMDEVVSDLMARKGNKVHYNIWKMNCEHYVTLWKYGKAWSTQTENVITTVSNLSKVVNDKISSIFAPFISKGEKIVNFFLN